MHIVSRKTIMEYWVTHPDVEGALKAWYAEAKAASWRTPIEIKKRYLSGDILNDNRFVFNIKGNHYRLIVKIEYTAGIIYVRFFGTHAEYDRIDAEKI